jgi:hypothetical protein
MKRAVSQNMRPSGSLREWELGECGDDLSAWSSAKYFTPGFAWRRATRSPVARCSPRGTWRSGSRAVPWLCLAPSNKISGGKVLSSRDAALGEPGCGAPEACCGNDRTNRHRPRRLLRAALRAHWQGQGDHCDRTQDRSSLLQRHASRDGLLERFQTSNHMGCSKRPHPVEGKPNQRCN